METIEAGIGKRIRKIREARNITREQLADDIGISTKFLYEIETGKKGFSASYIVPMVKCLSVSSDYLLFGKNDLPQSSPNIGDIDNCLSGLSSLITTLSVAQKEKLYDLLSTAIKLCE